MDCIPPEDKYCLSIFSILNFCANVENVSKETKRAKDSAQTGTKLGAGIFGKPGGNA